MIIWFSGQSGSGKTTLARSIAEKLNAVILDGDEMRATISEGAGFSPEDREAHNIRVAKLAKLLDAQGFNVIVSVIAPFQRTRDIIDKIMFERTFLWIYVKNDKVGVSQDKPYEVNDNYIKVRFDKDSLSEVVEFIKDRIYD